jgi:PIN domain nuclease of toxin-antitoxin system
MVNYILDACALIALLNMEEGSECVADLYEKANNGEVKLIMNKVNLLEVYYGYLKADGEEFAKRQITLIENSHINVVDVISNNIMLQAGRVKNMHRRISLADAFAIAQTIVSDGILVTSDHHELNAVDDAGIVQFLWIR